MSIEPTPTQSMPPLLTQPVKRLVAQLKTTPSRWMLAVAGMPGSGKTTLASHLVEAINMRVAPNTAVALGMDGFHFTKAALRQFPNPAEAFARRGAPWTFDAFALLQRLQLLRMSAGCADIPWPAFEHAVGDPVEGALAVLASTRLVIVEGLYLLHRADGWEPISQLFDERWYLDTPLETALERLALRHMEVWGITRDAAEHRIATSDRLNAELVRDNAGYADWRLVIERGL
jgi:pantothenate kinase